MRIICLIFCSVTLLLSCSKEKRFVNYKDGVEHLFVGHFYDGYYLSSDNRLKNDVVSGKVAIVINQSQLDSLCETVRMSELLPGNQESDLGINSVYNQTEFTKHIDFNRDVLFVIGFQFMRAEGKLKKEDDRIKINDSNETIRFDFGIRRRRAGSGEIELTALWFIKVPKEKANYSVEGTVTISNTAGINGLTAPKERLEFK